MGKVPPVLAFDFMHITFRDMLWAPVTTDALAIAFPAEAAADDEDEDEVEGENKHGGSQNRLESRVETAMPGAFARLKGGVSVPVVRALMTRKMTWTA